jgi:cell division transport system ATP-binding protein
MSETSAEQSKVISILGVDIYQGKTLVLQELNFDIKQGEFVYLIGKTGAGKSSLLKTLYGELPLMKGEIAIAETLLSKLKRKQIPVLRRKLGIVFQDFQLLTDRSVHDNLRFVLKATGWKDKDAIRQRIEEVLQLVGLPTKDFKMPHELSGGEQQRVVIARALLNKPEIILADEPTGNLDPDTSQEIMKLLIQISKEQNTAVLMATHDYMIIERFPGRLLKCEGGKVIDLGGILF